MSVINFFCSLSVVLIVLFFHSGNIHFIRIHNQNSQGFVCDILRTCKQWSLEAIVTNQTTHTPLCASMTTPCSSEKNPARPFQKGDVVKPAAVSTAADAFTYCISSTATPHQHPSSAVCQRSYCHSPIFDWMRSDQDTSYQSSLNSYYNLSARDLSDIHPSILLKVALVGLWKSPMDKNKDKSHHLTSRQHAHAVTPGLKDQAPLFGCISILLTLEKAFVRHR